jgi:hypothetical protein
MIEIDKGIPMPALGSAKKYPFKDMEVGDSFFVEENEKNGDINAIQKRLSVSAYGYRPRKFSALKVEGGVRVWRIA